MDEPREEASGGQGRRLWGPAPASPSAVHPEEPLPSPAARAADPSLGADRGGGSLLPLSPHWEPGL